MVDISNDTHWNRAAEFVKKTGCHPKSIVAPREFDQLIPGIVSYEDRRRCITPAIVVLQKDSLEALGRQWVEATAARFHPAYGNEVFVVLSAAAPRESIGYPSHFQTLFDYLHQREDHSAVGPEAVAAADVPKPVRAGSSLGDLVLVFRDRLFADPCSAVPLVIRVVTTYGRKYWQWYAIAYVLMATTASCLALNTYLFGHFVNETLTSRSFGAIVALSLVTALLYTVKGLATYGSTVALTTVGNSITAENTRSMFNKLVHQSLSYFESRPSSAMMAQVNFGAAAVPALLNLLVTTGGRDALTLIGLATVMVIQDPFMSLLVLVIMPPALLLLRSLRERVRTLAMTRFDGGAALMETVQEALQGLRVVKTFGLENTMQRRVADSAELMRQTSNDLARLTNRSGPIMETLGGLAVALIFLYAGVRVIQGDATPGQFVSFIAAFLLAYEPAKRLARIHLDFINQLVSVRMMYELLDSAPTEPKDDTNPHLWLDRGRIEFIDVDFAYRPREPVLRRMSFEAAPGCTTALVGHSGGGKSTALSLILRLYDVNGGAIRIDGQNIATLSRQSVRDQISYVGQEVFLFRGTVKENIAVGKPNARESEIIAAAKAAQAHEFISSFPLGYDSAVGEHGLQLSAGQRQRIAVARAMLKDAPIILLDEPTAALDTDSEYEVQRALAKLCAGRTTLVIAHRLHTVTSADCIHVVEDGAIIESGCHQDLLRAGARYAHFYNLLLRHQESPR